MLAEIGPSPLTLGGVSPEKVVSLPLLAGKLLYRLFGFEARSPKEEHRGRQPLAGFRVHPKCLMTTGYEAYIGSSSLGWGQDG